jgi:hypothetical protein
MNRAGKEEFWRSIATKINECFGTAFTNQQVKNKWKNLVQEYTVNIYID